MRIAVVTIDLMALFAWIYARSGSVDERAVPLVERTNALDLSARKMLAVRMLGVPLVIAVLLHFTGVLDRISFLLTQERGSGASSGAAMPTRSLSAYAGWWGDAHTPFGPGWVTRVIVRVDGDAAHAAGAPGARAKPGCAAQDAGGDGAGERHADGGDADGRVIGSAAARTCSHFGIASVSHALARKPP